MIYKLVNIIQVILIKYKFLRKKVFLKYTVRVTKDTFFEGSNDIKSHTNLSGAYIGFGTYIGEGCNLHRANIGRFCSIANDVKVVISDHPIETVSTHPCFHRGSHRIMSKIGLGMNIERCLNKDRHKEQDFTVCIGSDVWLGESVKLIGGIKIGDGAVIGAGAIVTKDVPPYSVCVGVPAKIIKYRFSHEVIDFLIKDKWWNESPDELRKIEELFLDVSKYIEFRRSYRDENR